MLLLLLFLPKFGLALFSSNHHRSGCRSQPISKLENQHHRRLQEPFSATLQAFQSQVSNYFRQISSHPKPSCTFIHIPKFLQILHHINTAFANLLLEIEYPTTIWKHSSIDHYLDYSINLLQQLNSITSSISALKQDHLSLSHALSRVHGSPSLPANKFLGFQSEKPHVDYKTLPTQPIKESDSAYLNEERVIHLALSDMKKIGSLVYGLIQSSLSNDAKICIDIRKSAQEILDSNPKQEYDDGKVEELTKRLQVFKEGLTHLEHEGDCLFSQILASRNELLDRIRTKISN